MMSPELMKILCCPETHQKLTALALAQTEEINRQIASGKLMDRSGHVVREAIDGGFLRADGKMVYPTRGNIPVLLIDRGILL